ncbi:MAG: bifunctional adenosylcobinamide kinase/adenosylcobinamide-phosphate guanylyltransferase [Pseudomonadota bacterium]
MKTEITLVIGGCRSGKSRYALDKANSLGGTKNMFIATSIPEDPDMEDRVRRHRKERGNKWITAEVPVDIAACIHEQSSGADVILVDCLTLWVSNLMLSRVDHDGILEKTRALVEVLGKASCPVILVSNEVGAGIVPENRLARQFRDMAGFVNQRMAAAADKVVWMVAGIPVTVKHPEKKLFL